MKTFREFQDRATERDPFDTYAKINKWAAKEYAKQWVDRLAKAMDKNQGYGSMSSDHIVNIIKAEIDNQ